MANKTMDVVVVYDKNAEEIVGAFTNLDEAITGITNHIIKHVTDFEDFIGDYKDYLNDFVDRFYRYDDVTDEAPDCFADWIKKAVSDYDDCDWNDNILSYFTVTTTPLTLGADLSRTL